VLLVFGRRPAQPHRSTIPAPKQSRECVECFREEGGLLSEWGPDLFGRAQNRWRIIRTSNAYTFNDPQPTARPPDSSKSKFPTGTEGQDLHLLAPQPLDPANSLHQAFLRLGEGVKGAAPTGAASLAI
jgi:hypothetical protein